MAVLAGIRGEGDGDVEVEDLLVEAVFVQGCVEEDEPDRRDDEHKGQHCERRQPVIP